MSFWVMEYFAWTQVDSCGTLLSYFSLALRSFLSGSTYWPSPSNNEVMNFQILLLPEIGDLLRVKKMPITHIHILEKMSH
jgi:hypothetical protein